MICRIPTKNPGIIPPRNHGCITSRWTSRLRSIFILLCLSLIFSFVRASLSIYLYFSSFLVRRLLGWWRDFNLESLVAFGPATAAEKSVFGVVWHFPLFKYLEWGAAFPHAMQLGQMVVYFDIFPVFPHLQFGDQFVCSSSMLFIFPARLPS